MKTDDAGQNSTVRKPTIKDVAREAGVSIATVSRILNDAGGYSLETREQVQQVIRTLGYEPNAVARGLILKKTRTIGVMFPDVSSRFTSELLRGIEKTAHGASHNVMICNTENDGMRTLDYIHVMGERQLDALIIVSEPILDNYVPELKRLGIPVVLVSTMSLNEPIPYVKVDDFSAARDAVRFLIGKGHREIAFISGSPDDPISGRPRLDGYRAALQEAGLSFRNELLAFGDFRFQSGFDAMAELYSRGVSLTAVFAASDEMALGVLSFAYSRGIRVPDELSLVGYDDTQDALMSVPPLTTVHQPLFEMGARAVEKVLSGDGLAPEVIPHRIVERDSVRDLRRNG